MPVHEASHILHSPWTPPLPISAILLVLLVAYVWVWFAARQKSAIGVGAWRFAAFCAGIATLGLAWSRRLAAYTDLLLTAHMTQHLLFMLIAPPLLLLGEPMLLSSRAFPCGGTRRPGMPAWRRSWNFLTHPIPAAVLMVATTIAWHVPPIFALAMRHPAWHQVEDTSFLFTGILFWWPVILPWPGKRQWPRWAIPLYLLGADMPVSALSAYLAFCGQVVFPAYLAAPRPFPISPLDDQVAAAMLMWTAMMVVFAAVSIVIVVDILDNPRRTA
jgi:cytochrome c oxidase assembly factor CtaG